MTDSKHGNLDQLEDKAYNSQTNFAGGQIGTGIHKQNSQRAFVSPGQRVPSLQRPPQRSALPAIDQQKQKEKLRKMMGDSVEDINDLMPVSPTQDDGEGLNCPQSMQQNSITKNDVGYDLRKPAAVRKKVS